MAEKQGKASLRDHGWLINRQSYFALRNERLSSLWREKE